MTSEKKLWDAKPIPRLHYKDPKIDELIKANILLLLKPAKEKWTLEYLEKNLGSSGHTVYLSRNHKFKFYDDKKVLSRNNPKGIEFTPPTKKS
ncbi:hypothetical protein NQ317_017568 [Molorchus minor]|uniref:Ribosomal protein L31 n=1 Tax=Molorchus minor TaxID=1323400 RepID=A0ABQ9J720_9CUCU|nr:hypothetical protein NQ317_017568 [Molorchus minor]